MSKCASARRHPSSALALALAALALAGCVSGSSGAAPPAEAAAPPQNSAAPGKAATSDPAAKSAATPLKACSSLAKASDGLIDDLEDNNGAEPTTAGRAGNWGTASDDKGTTVTPKGDFKPSPGGAGGSKYAAHMSGKTGAGDDAWGATMNVALNNWQAYDGSKYAGLRFWAKAGAGSTSNVRIRISDGQTVPEGGLCKQCWNDFGKDLQLTNEWKEYTVSFAELAQQQGWGEPYPHLDASRLWSVQWAVGEKGKDFDVWVDNVEFVTCP